MSGRHTSRADPVDRVLITAATVLNAWRSMRPTKRPGRARSWLNPSWPTGLLLHSYRDRLAAELARDRVLRAHTRARLDIPPLSPADAAAIVSKAESIASRSATGDDSPSGEPIDPPVLVAPGMLAAALLAQDDDVAAAAATLLHDLPAAAVHGIQELGEFGGAEDIADSAGEEGDSSGKGQQDHHGPSEELQTAAAAVESVRCRDAPATRGAGRCPC